MPVLRFLKVTHGLSHYALYSYSFKFSICFTANKMQKAETVLISIAKQIDQLPLQSHCCEVVTEETYFVLRGRFSKVSKCPVESSWVFRWAQQASGTSQMSECFKRALSPAAPMEENGLYLCVKKPAGKCCCFTLEYKTEDDSSVYSLDQISYLLCLTCLPALQHLLVPLGSHLDLVMAILYETP